MHSTLRIWLQSTFQVKVIPIKVWGDATFDALKMSILVPTKHSGDTNKLCSYLISDILLSTGRCLKRYHTLDREWHSQAVETSMQNTLCD